MRYILTLFFIVFSAGLHALALKADAPARYVVQSGDSLWEIAAQYLEHPWEWKALWHANPSIKNPNRIYPGTVIVLRYKNQNPYLKVLSNGTIKLSPYMRPKPLEHSIPPIPLADIKPFLNPSLVLDRNLLADAPYIVAFTMEHLLGGQGDEVYVKGLCLDPKASSGTTVSYSIFRPEGEYLDPHTHDFLGYKATLVAYAELIQPTEPAKIVLTDILMGVKLSDRVMPNTKRYFNLYFEPKAPALPIRGSIVDLPGDYTQGAVGLVAVINRGKDAGLEPGDVLAIYGPSRIVRNPEFPPRKVKLPPDRIGEVMVFRTFSRTSFALVMRSTRAVKPKDTVTNP